MVDSIKHGLSDTIKAAAKAAQAAAQAAAKAAAAAAARAAAEAAAKASGKHEGFDDAKKKPLSMTGKFKPVTNPLQGNAQLQGEVSSARLATQAGGAKAPSTIAMTAGPGGINKADAPKPSAAGKVSQKEWDNPQLLLAKLTQNPATGPTANSGQRCGPSNLLGAALMQGPASAAKLLTSVADAPKNNRLSAAEKTELKQLAERIKNKEASFEDLGRAQDLLYKSGNRVRDVASTVQEALTPPASNKLTSAERSELQGLLSKEGTPENMRRVGELVTLATGHPTRIVKDPDAPGSFLATVEGSRSANDTSAYTDRELYELAELGGTKKGVEPLEGTLKDVFKSLKPGESMVIRVSAHDLDPSATQGIEPDHFVTIGRRKDGTAFIYNPDPSKGDPTVFVGGKGAKQSAAFMAQLAKYEDRTSLDRNGNPPNMTRLQIE